MMTQTPDDIRAAWDSIAAGYDKFVTASHLRLGDDALRRAGLQAGMRFLDVAAGSGALSIPAARRGAQVLAVDLSPVMVERLAVRARHEGLSNLESRVMDGHALELDDNTFDLSGSQFGVMLFPDLQRGLRELVRVTRPGGRVMLVVFGSPTKVEFLSFFIAAVREVVPQFAGLQMDPPPLPFQVADPEVLRQRLAEARLRDIRVEATTEELAFESASQLWNWLAHSNPIGAGLIAGLTEEQRARVQQVLDDMLRARAGGDGPAILTSPINIGIGTV